MRTAFFLVAVFSVCHAFSQTKKGSLTKDLSLLPLRLKTTELAPLQLSAKTAGTLKTSAVCLASCVLPVKWLRLEGERKNDSLCLLKWETTNEVNNRGFEVERSLGNAEKFEKAGFVSTLQKADPVLAYQFNDANDFPGISYYRLRQIDNNNSFTFSKTIAIKGYSKVEGLQVYPNPANNHIQVRVNATMSGKVQWLLLDATGKVVMQKTGTLQKGENLFAWEITSLAKGTYLLQAQLPAGKTHSAVLIKN